MLIKSAVCGMASPRSTSHTPYLFRTHVMSLAFLRLIYILHESGSCMSPYCRLYVVASNVVCGFTILSVTKEANCIEWQAKRKQNAF